MIKIFDISTGEEIGEISEGQLQFMIDQLEEESMEDQDYSITPMLISFWEGKGADPGLIKLLKEALGKENEVIIRWVRS